MTASGPMAQGPLMGGSGRSTPRGIAFGVGMSAPSKIGEADSDEYKSDYSGYSDAEEDDERTTRRRVPNVVDLDEIGDEDEMAPMVLPPDPEKMRDRETRKAAKREQERAEKMRKMEVKLEDEDEGTGSWQGSGTATPALVMGEEVKKSIEAMEIDSKETSRRATTVSGMDVDEEKKLTPKTEEDLTDDFVLPESNSERLYIFQFPREFPVFASPSQIADPSSSFLTRTAGVVKKEDPDAPQDGPFGFGAGTSWNDRKGAKAAEVVGCTEGGQIGELIVRRSGRVRLKLGEVEYDILAGAPPSFLQEIAIIDPPQSVVNPLNEPEPDSTLPKPHRRAMYVMGQTNKKYLCAPDIGYLLARWDEAEKDRLDKERVKKEQERLEALAPKKPIGRGSGTPVPGGRGAPSGRATPPGRGALRGVGRGRGTPVPAQAKGAGPSAEQTGSLQTVPAMTAPPPPRGRGRGTRGMPS
ncbi:hypothetical protein BT69DRAFT_1281250 [Atractiella rhizophila]|nr:hypothetical protein BT69DRAFT_1281250 [Atractiella rhizophila]